MNRSRARVDRRTLTAIPIGLAGRGGGLLLLALVLGGCSAPRGAPSATLATAVRRVAVLPAHNSTGQELVVSGSSLLEQYAFHSDRVTVPDELSAFARQTLERQGFDVVPAEIVEQATGGRTPASPEAAVTLARDAKLDAMALYIDVRRWESDAELHTDTVLVATDMVLLDPASGGVLWEARRATRPEPLRATVLRGQAYTIVAQKVVDEMLAPLGAAHPQG